MNEEYIKTAAAFTTNWLFKHHTNAALELFGTKHTAFEYAIFASNQKIKSVDPKQTEHAKVCYLVAYLKEFFLDYLRRDLGINVKGKKRYETPTDPWQLNAIGGNDQLFEVVIGDDLNAERMQIVIKRLSDYDKKFGFDYSQRFQKFAAAGYSEANAARMFGGTRQSWSYFKLKVIDIVNGAPPRLRRDRREKLEKK